MSLYELSGRVNYWVNCELNRYRFNLVDFTSMCQYIQSLNTNDFQIVCIENMNPRPETLIYDIRILRKIYSAKELREFLRIVFTFSKGAEKSSEEVKNGVLTYKDLFEKYLEIFNQSEKEKFYNRNILLFQR